MKPFQICQIAVFASGILYWAGVITQSVRLRRKLGTWPNVRPRGLKERLLWTGWLTVIAVWIGQPLIMNHLAHLRLFQIIGPFGNGWFQVIGLILIVAGQLGTYWAYEAMGNSWRMGVQEGDKTDLVTGGPYALMRHPIYSFQILMLLGAAFLLPTALSFITLGLHLVCCSIKMNDEENYLSRTHQDYGAYRKKTGQFFPRIHKSLATPDQPIRPAPAPSGGSLFDEISY